MAGKEQYLATVVLFLIIVIKVSIDSCKKDILHCDEEGNLFYK